MKKIKTVTFTFNRNDFPKKGEWFKVNNKFIIANFEFEENKYDIYTKAETEEVWKPKIDLIDLPPEDQAKVLNSAAVFFNTRNYL